MTSGPVDLNDYRNWWAYVPGANWRHPEGPESSLHGRERHPVTQVAFEDAEAYAAWAGKELPTEAEWEYAARGGLEGATFVWGEEFAPKGKMMANTWQGEFPWQNLLTDGYDRTSPVKSFPPNGYGLFDVAGNVWEWTTDYFTPRHPDEVEHPCCTPHNPRVTETRPAHRGRPRHRPFPRKVIKGGSHLCAPELLPPLPTRGAFRRDHRDIHRSHRLPVRRSERRNLRQGLPSWRRRTRYVAHVAS